MAFFGKAEETISLKRIVRVNANIVRTSQIGIIRIIINTIHCAIAKMRTRNFWNLLVGLTRIFWGQSKTLIQPSHRVTNFRDLLREFYLQNPDRHIEYTWRPLAFGKKTYDISASRRHKTIALPDVTSPTKRLSLWCHCSN